jgi:hypothetical protein
MTTSTKRASGALFGLAFGDALGARTEFLSFERILREFPPAGPMDLEGNPALVTDDTQMTLAVGEALLEAPRPLTAAHLEPVLRRQLVEWSLSPDNTRAPGNTCLQACAHLEKGMPWERATIAASKGCGANMRVAPVGLTLDPKRARHDGHHPRCHGPVSSRPDPQSPNRAGDSRSDRHGRLLSGKRSPAKRAAFLDAHLRRKPAPGLSRGLAWPPVGATWWHLGGGLYRPWLGGVPDPPSGEPH